MATTQEVLDAVKELRAENRQEHAAIASCLSTHSERLTRVETRWCTTWKVVKAMLWGLGVAATIAGCVLGLA